MIYRLIKIFVRYFMIFFIVIYFSCLFSPVFEVLLFTICSLLSVIALITFTVSLLPKHWKKAILLHLLTTTLTASLYMIKFKMGYENIIDPIIFIISPGSWTHFLDDIFKNYLYHSRLSFITLYSVNFCTYISIFSISHILYKQCGRFALKVRFIDRLKP